MVRERTVDSQRNFAGLGHCIGHLGVCMYRTPFLFEPIAWQLWEDGRWSGIIERMVGGQNVCLFF
jgi:hypothetical protein